MTASSSTPPAGSPAPESKPANESPGVPPGPTWIIEGLGSIRRAEIEVAPLTLLVGENNTGKSYMATLLWGLWNTLTKFFYDFAMEQAAQQPAAVRDSLHVFTESVKQSLALSQQDSAQLRQTAMDLLQKNLPGFVRRLFNGEWVSLKSLHGVQTLPPRKLEVAAHEVKLLEAMDKSGLAAFWAITAAQTLTRINIPDFRATYPTFLPASRTGFMLLYPTATQYSIESIYGGRENRRLPLPLPATELLQFLSTGFRTPLGPFAEEAALIEAELGGRLAIEGAVGINDYRFQVDKGPALPLPLVSSLVTELAPIILTLRHAQKLPFLVIEEPEAHLHPRLQRVMARVLVRLVRKGTRVVVTTHSDLLCQQFNNFMRLGMHSVDERAAISQQPGYSDADFLLPAEVRGYSFARGADGTEVTALPANEYGIAMPTFNDELDRLLNESHTLDRAPAPVPLKLEDGT